MFVHSLTGKSVSRKVVGSGLYSTERLVLADYAVSVRSTDISLSPTLSSQLISSVLIPTFTQTANLSL